MARLFIALLSAALALPACATDSKPKTRAEAAKVDKEKERAAKKRSEQARSQGSASSGQSAPPAGGTDLGAEAEKEEARMRKPLDSGR